MELTVTQIAKVLGMFMLIFLLVFLLAILTPRLAKLCDRFIGKLFKKGSNDSASEIYRVRSIYDMPQKDILDKNDNKDGEEKNGEE